MRTPEEIENHQIAVHEQGHRLVNLKYGKHCRVTVLSPADRFPQNKNDTTVLVAGYCERDELQTITPFQRAVSSWSGLVGELVAGVPNPTIPISVPFNAKNLKAAFHEIMVSFDAKMSLADQQGILGYKKSLFSTFRRSWQILRPKKKELIRLAEQMCRAGEKQLLPENTPAPASSEQTAIKHRADLLREFLVAMTPENPDRPRLEKYLVCLEGGKWPSAEGTNDATQKI